MLDWWRHLSRLGKIAGIVGAITGAIVGVAAAWPIIEWAVPAHRGLLYEKIGGVQATTNELLIWKFEDQKNTLSREQRGLNIILKKETDPELQRDIQRSIEKSSKEEQTIDDRIRKLKGQ